MDANAKQNPRVALLMQFYDPEPIYKGQAFAEAIARSGYDVEVVTGFPNYPGGKVYDGYRIRPLQREVRNGIKITRLALYPSHDRSRLGRVLNYVSFFLSAFLYLTLLARRAHLIYAYHPPLTVGLAGAFAGLLRRTPLVVDIHDLWPDALPTSGMLTNPRLLRVVDVFCNLLYRRSAHIILHSHGFRRTLLARGVPADKMTTIIGWTNEHAEVPTDSGVTPSAMDGAPGIRVLYAGNMGPAQALDSVIEAARQLDAAGETSTATFFFLGSGIALDRLKEQASGLANVVFLPRVAPAEVGAYLKAADCLLVHLRDDPLFKQNMPSKLQAYLLAGRPILMGVRGEAAELVREVGAGLVAIPEDPDSIAQSVRAFAALPKETRDQMGEAGRRYYWQELCMEKGVARFAEVFERIRRAV